jgi:hypothetical protein
MHISPPQRNIRAANSYVPTGPPSAASWIARIPTWSGLLLILGVLSMDAFERMRVSDRVTVVSWPTIAKVIPMRFRPSCENEVFGCNVIGSKGSDGFGEC